MGIIVGMGGYLNPKINITSEILRIISALDEFKGRWTTTHLLAPDRLASLKQIATIESIGSSTRIEGVKLTDSEIEALLRGLKTYSFRSRDEQEVGGYAELMELIFGSWAEIPLSENHIKQLHGVLLKYSTKDERHRGEYKKFPNHMEAFGPDGKRLGVIFETTTPFDTPQKMSELVGWTNAQLHTQEQHPLLVISVFVVIFLKIHPFQDGNGRLSRVLTTLLLLRCGYTYVPYSSLERVIEENKQSYYLSLRKAQSTLEKNDTELHVWILFFLQCLKKQKQALESKLTNEVLLLRLPMLSQQIVDLIQQRGATSISEVVSVTQANRNTIKAHLRKLVELGHLVSEGKRKGTRYRLKSL